MVTSGTGPGGLTFSGTFSSATWVESTVNGLNYWTFTGSIVNGMLTEGGVTMKDINGATIELTTLGGGPTVNSGGFNQWTDSGGTSTLNLPLAPVPEPGYVDFAWERAGLHRNVCETPAFQEIDLVRVESRLLGCFFGRTRQPVPESRKSV